MQKIFYYRLTAEKKFHLKWGYLVKLTDHELQIKYNNHVYCIRSDYNLFEMLHGEILDAVLVKSKFSRYYKLRPLPHKAEFYDSLNESEFPFLTSEERKEIVYEDQDILAKTKKQEILTEQLQEKLQRSQEFAYSQVLIAQTLPGQIPTPSFSMKNLADQEDLDVFCVGKKPAKTDSVSKNKESISPEIPRTTSKKAKESVFSTKWEKKVKEYVNR